MDEKRPKENGAERTRIKQVLKRRNKEIKAAEDRGAAALQRGERQTEEQRRVELRSQVAQFAADIGELLSGKRERRAKRAKFQELAAEFKQRLRDLGLLTPEVQELVDEANQALIRQDRMAAADIFLQIGSIVEPIITNQLSRSSTRRRVSVEECTQVVRRVIPPEAGIARVMCNMDACEVTVAVDRPEVAIGLHGANLLAIRVATGWRVTIIEG